MTLQATRRLTDMDFTGGNHAVALVSKSQGGAANGYKTLVMKGTDVVVELSMAEYLYAFFDVWSGDAEFIAKILGYSDDFDLWDFSKIEAKTTILNEMRDIYKAKGKLEVDLAPVADITKALATNTNRVITDYQEIKKAANGDVPVSEIKTSPKEVTTMSQEAIEKAVNEALAAKKEEIEKAAEARVLAEQAEIQKGLQSQIDEFLAEKVEIEKAAFITKAKNFEDLGVTDFESFGVAIMKASKDSEMKVLVETLEKAVELTKGLETPEVGHGLDQEATKTSLHDIAKAQGKISK